MDVNYIDDFDVLIKISVEIGNKLQGVKITDEKKHLAEGLGKKIINHILSAKHLYNGYQLIIDKNKYEPIIDFSSIAILTRAALETYLTFNYVFIANEAEKEFRFLCWDLSGFMERSGIIPKSKIYISKLEAEKKSIEIIKKRLNDNLIFQNLTNKNKEKVLAGNWKLDNSWNKLAVDAGFSKIFFTQQYKFLCCHAHSSRLSVIQIQQTKTIDSQKEMSNGFLGTLMVVLAKYISNYIDFMPELYEVKQQLENYTVIQKWKSIGESL